VNKRFLLHTNIFQYSVSKERNRSGLLFYTLAKTTIELSESVSLPSLAWSLEYINAMNVEIDSVCGASPSGIDLLVRESVSSGRRTRAILAMLWCEALSGDYHPAIPVAAAYELAHAAALLEDDIIDGSKSKLGEDTFQVKHGIPRALLVSNTLLFYAPSLISRYSNSGTDYRVVEKLLQLLGDCGRLSAKGEFLDLEMAQMDDVPETLYESMISMKTGALVGASSASGALIGGPNFDPSTIEVAYSFGESLGIAYQIWDDLQDYFGDESTSGKALFCDLKNGKKSLPLIHTLKFANGDERDFIHQILRGSEALTINREKEVRALLSKYDSQDYCRELAMKFVRKAELSLSVIRNPSTAKNRLFEVVQYLSHKN
jgi:geranylgeranyl pyrophosphate synthase